MEGNDPARAHATVHGRVQGVSFRYFVIESVRGLGLSGWVRNRFNGTVEVIAEGERNNLDILIQNLHKGPISAQVMKVDIQWEEPSGDFKSFRIRMTR